MVDNERRFDATLCPVGATGIGDGAGSRDPGNLGGPGLQAHSVSPIASVNYELQVYRIQELRENRILQALDVHTRSGRIVLAVSF